MDGGWLGVFHVEMLFLRFVINYVINETRLSAVINIYAGVSVQWSWANVAEDSSVSLGCFGMQLRCCLCVYSGGPGGASQPTYFLRTRGFGGGISQINIQEVGSAPASLNDGVIFPKSRTFF